jgi:hypothetical protein
MKNRKGVLITALHCSIVHRSSGVRSNKLIRKWLLVISYLSWAQLSFSQKVDSTKNINHFGAGISVTNNGIAFVPAFSLGKPAVVFDFSAGRKLSFDPQFRFALDGKPWAFLFSWRYKLLSNKKFRLIIGAHPSLNFRTVSVTTDGVSTNRTIVVRNLTPDFASNYFVSKNISVGVYYLYSFAVDNPAIRNTHLISINNNFSKIKLSNHYYLRFAPQVYYLKQAQYDGFYVASTLSLARKDFPLSLSSIVNKAIRTNVPGSPDLVWNLIITYAFSKLYVIK